MLPSFIIAGAGKSGTTFLWECMNDHPEICMATDKEPRFFTQLVGLTDGGNSESHGLFSGQYSKGMKWYESLYSHCSNNSVCGEASTVYMYAEDSPALIKRALPKVKLIFILRDPVDRLWSNYLQEIKKGWRLPDFQTLVTNENPRFLRYCYNSSYKRHLQRYFRTFSADNILILLFDDLKADALRLVQKCYEFVGVAMDYTPGSLDSRVNAAARPRIMMLQRIILRISISRLLIRSPPTVKSRLSRIRKIIQYFNMKSCKNRPIPYHIRELLIERFDEDINYVSNLVKSPIESWKKSLRSSG